MRSEAGANDDHYLKRELDELLRGQPEIFDILQARLFDGVWFWDLEDRAHLWMSASFWELLGYAPASKKHLASEWEDVIHPDDLRLAVDALEKHCADPEPPYDRYLRLRHRNGSTVRVRCRGVALRHGVGKPTRMLAVHQDVTALERAVERSALVESHAPPEEIGQRKATEAMRSTLAAIVESSSDAIVSKGLDGIITSWNRGAQAIFGYSPEEAIGQPMTILFPPHRVDEERRLLERLRRGEKVESYESVRMRKDGAEIDVSVTASPVRNASGAIVGFSKIARDITETKRMQRDLLRAKEATEEANRELQAFSYSVAHDLRAPLRAIDGFSQALVEDCSERLDANGRRYLGLVRDSAQLMARLIDDLLALTRVTRAELRRERVDLSALARAAFGRLQRAEPRRHVEVSIRDDLACDGDPTLLGMVLDNLLGNAWKFTSKRVGARIEVGVVTANDEDAYFVRDNGAGFDMTYAGKLFGLFQRLHNVRDFEGTGVGLAIVQRIVHRHGGKVWAEGKVGEGATFHFTLGGQEQRT